MLLLLRMLYLHAPWRTAAITIAPYLVDNVRPGKAGAFLFSTTTANALVSMRRVGRCYNAFGIQTTDSERTKNHATVLLSLSTVSKLN